MTQDEIYLSDMWRILVREWKWFVIALALTMVGAFTATRLVKPQWEAHAWIRIGQVGAVPAGEDPKAEPLAAVLERLKLIPFENGVVASLGLSPRSPAAGLYRKSLKLDPLPYAGPLIELSVRANSPKLARRLVEATVSGLQAAHQRLDAPRLSQAETSLQSVQRNLEAISAERSRLMQTAASGKNVSDGSGRSLDLFLAGTLLTGIDQELRGLQQARNDLTVRLSPVYTYQTSLAWPIYVPDHPVFPNTTLMWLLGIVAGIAFGVFAAVVRNALRRRAAASRFAGSPVPEAGMGRG